MKKGRMPDVQRLRYVLEIRDVEVFGDGQLYTIWVLEEDLAQRKNGQYKLGPKARVVNIRLQEPYPSHKEVHITELILRRIRRRFRRKKGVSG